MQLGLQPFQDNATKCPVCGSGFKSAKGFGPHFRHKHPDKHPVIERIRADFKRPPDEILRILHWKYSMPVLQISERFGYPRDGLMDAFDKLEIDRDSRTGLERLWEERPDYAKKHAQRAAPLGTPNRETNGMKGVTGEDAPLWGVTGEDHPAYGIRGEDHHMYGVTGQDHPCYRGGKSIYDAVKKQLHGLSWDTARDRIREQAGHECEMCGEHADTIDHRGLDVHHLIPVLSGGTNEDWNLMALCTGCHKKAEWYLRSIPELDPVLIE